MERTFSGFGMKTRGSRRALWSALVAFGMVVTAAAEGRELLVPSGGLLHVEVQSCQLQCGRTLAECERKRAKGAHCPRDYQFCRSDCEKPDNKPAQDAVAQRKAICVQRCETSASLCEQNTVQGETHCSVGQSLCIARC